MEENTYRPYFNHSSKDIAERGITAAKTGDLETLSYCWLELAPERRQRGDVHRQMLESVMSELKVEPISWLENAATITKRFHCDTDGEYSVYIILLTGVKEGYGLYVGQTYWTPEERFEQHKTGRHSSHHVRNHGYRLLPSLYEHLFTMTQDESLELEGKIAVALEEGGIYVEGGQK